jgi:hypothetical protein
MPVYKLDPIWGKEGHGDWQFSTLAPTPVWVRADNPEQARHRIHLATRTELISVEGIKAPWINAQLVKCIEDASFDVPSDVAFLANGKITIKL